MRQSSTRIYCEIPKAIFPWIIFIHDTENVLFAKNNLLTYHMASLGYFAIPDGLPGSRPAGASLAQRQTRKDQLISPRHWRNTMINLNEIKSAWRCPSGYIVIVLNNRVSWKHPEKTSLPLRDGVSGRHWRNSNAPGARLCQETAV